MTVGHRPEELGGEDVRAARIVREDLAPGLLGGPPAVDVGGVEEVDAGVKGRSGTRLRALPAHSPGVGQPRSERDLGDVQVTAAQGAVFHLRPPGEVSLVARDVGDRVGETCVLQPAGSPDDVAAVGAAETIRLESRPSPALRSHRALASRRHVRARNRQADTTWCWLRVGGPKDLPAHSLGVLRGHDNKSCCAPGIGY